MLPQGKAPPKLSPQEPTLQEPSPYQEVFKPAENLHDASCRGGSAGSSSVLSLSSLCLLSRAASLLSTVGWQGRRDFFFSPFSFTPPTPFWEAASSAAGSCQSQGHQAKEAGWPLGTTCLPPPHASYSQAISLEQGLITIQLSGRHRREWEKPGSTERG